MNKKESKYFNTASFFDEALLKLLETKDYEYITIKEICEKAGYNRSTFYLHYESIDDLLNECLEYIINKLVNKYKIESDNILFEFDKASKEDLIFINEEYLNPYLEFVKENKTIFKLAYKYPKILRVDETYNSLKINILNPTLDKFNIDQKKKEYMIDFYINGIMAIIKNWVTDDCVENKEFIIEIIKECVRL